MHQNLHQRGTVSLRLCLGCLSVSFLSSYLAFINRLFTKTYNRCPRTENPMNRSPSTAFFVFLLRIPWACLSPCSFVASASALTLRGVDARARKAEGACPMLPSGGRGLIRSSHRVQGSSGNLTRLTDLHSYSCSSLRTAYPTACSQKALFSVP